MPFAATTANWTETPQFLSARLAYSHVAYLDPQCIQANEILHIIEYSTLGDNDYIYGLLTLGAYVLLTGLHHEVTSLHTKH